MTELERYTLGLLAEEMGEALQLIGKALRFGLDTPGRTGDTARSLLPVELGDVRAAIAYAGLGGIVDAGEVHDRVTDKVEKLLDPDSLDNLGHRLAPALPGRP